MTRRRLTLLLLLFFLALALPTSILVYQAYGQLKWEAFHQHQQFARDLTLRIDTGFEELIAREESRPISDYEFLNVSGEQGSAFLQRSPLSEFPSQADFPGLLGYFQVDASGQLRTPILPRENALNYGITAPELRQREQQEGRIRGILDQNRLVVKSDLALAATLEQQQAEEIPVASESAVLERDDSVSALVSEDSDAGGKSFFDELSSRNLAAPESTTLSRSQVKDLKLEDSFEVAAESESLEKKSRIRQQADAKVARKEKVNLPKTLAAPAPQMGESSSAATDAPSAIAESVISQQAIRIQTFESEVDPMEFAQLDSGHFVLFRRVWHQNEPYVQGILIDQAGFIEQLVAPAFRQSTLSSMSNLIVAYRGGILRNFAPEYSSRYQPGAEQVADELLYQSRLVAPFGDVELIYTLASLPVGAGGKVIVWSAVVLAVVLVGGFLMLFRLGLRQLALARQQQDFVSAVSHELKTPLTSIRMYGEILREGWADEAKRKSYYDFIFHESERLTRLINNVLQLARMSRNEQVASVAKLSVDEIIAELRPRLESQLEPTTFELSIEGDEVAAEALIEVDKDWFLQIFINLVDNAVKFSGASEKRRIDIRYQLMQGRVIQFSVRDYGPGIAADQMKKIFQLFYRSENELTRETVGTGIGLALVHQLATAMRAEVDVVNCEPGAEFRIRFNTLKSTP